MTFFRAVLQFFFAVVAVFFRPFSSLFGCWLGREHTYVLAGCRFARRGKGSLGAQVFWRLPSYGLLLSLSLLASGCDDDEGMLPEDPITDPMIGGPAQPTPYSLEVPTYLPGPVSKPNNPLTEEGIQLGRKLFYDPILSRDSSMSCSSCHLQQLAFTDGLPKAIGVRGQAGARSAMSLVNMAFNPRPFNWDGSAVDLEEQALIPVEHILELDTNWETVVEKLQRHPTYPRDFRAAFGVDRVSQINREMVVKAIAQFERTLISANSRFDKVVYKNEGFFTELEQEGFELFFIEFISPSELHPGCSHCHNAPGFTDNQFHNNGIENVASLTDFPDLGRGGVNGNVFDNGKFRSTTLRNIELTAPYMHDGRFQTLEEVIEHYASGGHGSENKNPNVSGFELTPRKMEALVAFLKTLTDEEFTQEPRFSSPF